MTGESLGSAWYELGVRDSEFRSGVKRAEDQLRTSAKAGGEAFAREVEGGTRRAGTSVDGLVSKLNTLRGRGPQELAEQLQRATTEADEATAAVAKLKAAGDLDTAKARKYADQLNEIGIEADQTRADLMELAAADPRFDTPELQKAASELDRVGREASEAAGDLNRMKGVGADTHLERMGQEANEASRGLDKTGKSSDGLMTKLTSVKGVLAGLGLVIGAQQVLGFLGDASEAFREVEQTGRTVTAVYGESASTIEDWANRAATAAGMSKREVQESAAVMGTSLQNMGFDAQKAADITVRAQQRAADIAIAYGRDTGDAINGLNALLRGEFDTIEKFGVRIKQADVNARVLALGLDTTTIAAKREAEAIATLDLFFQQTAKSSGRFAQSQDELAVKLEQSQAKIENGMAVLGEWVAAVQLGLVETGEATSREVEDIGDMWDTLVARLTGTWDGMTNAERAAVENSNRSWQAYEESANKSVNSVTGAAVAGAGAQANALGGMPEAAADQLLANQFHLDTAIEQLLEFMSQALTPAQEIFNAQMFLASQELANGLNSGIPDVVAKAEEMRDAAIAVLNEFDAYGPGFRVGTSYAAGMDASYGWVRTSAGKLAKATRGQIGIDSEPKDADSPLRGITHWGGNIDRTIADDMLANVGVLWDAAGAAGGAIADGLHEALRQKGALGAFRPDVVLDTSQIRDLRTSVAADGSHPANNGGYALPQADPWMSARAGARHETSERDGLTFNQTLNVQGLVRAETPVDIGIQARRGAQLGVRAMGSRARIE